MLATILAGIAVLISGITCIAVLVLLGRKEFPYPRGEEDREDPIATLIRNQRVLWYALEDMDDRLNDAGLSVLRPRVHDDQAPASYR